jgi:c-type cytochrome biogenesis protein CcmF
MIGSIAMAVTLTAALASVILYTLVARGKGELLTAARFATHAAIIGVFVSAGTLLYYIFNYRFDINYVYEHVSRTLSKPLLFSTFYASQEGSFMLWALWTSIIAIFLMNYAARQRYEAHVMAVFMAVLTFLALMLVAKSPFQTIYAAHPGEVPAGFIPADGKGLNPSLENLWIVIHPPMLFLGFSLLAVPFAFAIAGLLKKDYQGWIATSMPWTLGAGMVLGFGVMLGGFWAYETLGWGGYWGWDPVENSSLLPWIITVASVHTMLTQRRTGGLVRTNIAMTLLAYALVLYSSFLTRSGILGDASVHAFTDAGSLAFSLLLGALLVFLVVAIFLFILRWRDMTSLGREYKVLSRETSLAIGSAVLGASALIVFIGTSAPLIHKKVDNGFYNNLHIPLVIVLLLVNGLSLLLKWKQTNSSELIKRSLVALSLSIVGTAVVFFLGVRDPQFVLMVLAAFFALFVNLEIGYQVFRGKFDISLVTGFAQSADVWKRFRTALYLVLIVGIAALLVWTAGDYYKFGDVILAAGPFVLIVLAVLTAVFVLAGYPKVTFDTKFLGAYVAHMGVAIFILGVVATARYSEKEVVQLVKGVPTKAFNGKYTLEYAGYTQAKPDYYRWTINVSDQKGFIGTARPLWFFTDFNNRESPILNPSILKFADRDLYFTTAGVDETGGMPHDTLGKGEVLKAFGGKVAVKFIDFNFPPDEKKKMFSGQMFRVEATVDVSGLSDTSVKAQTLVLSVVRKMSSQEAKEEDVVIPGTTYHLQLAELRPDMNKPANSKVVIRSFDTNNPPPKPKEFITVEAFVKPYINLVWGGILILVAGFGFAMMRRRREAGVAIERAEAKYERMTSHSAPSAAGQGPIPLQSSRPQLIKKQSRTGA